MEKAEKDEWMSIERKKTQVGKKLRGGGLLGWIR